MLLNMIWVRRLNAVSTAFCISEKDVVGRICIAMKGLSTLVLSERLRKYSGISR
jgi:hypothetical protein